MTDAESRQKAEEQAVPIRFIMEIVEQLDTDYLSDALKRMKSNHSFRDAAAVLSPSPFTHTESQDLDAAKLRQLELMLLLAENANKIKALNLKLQAERSNIDKLNNIFGIH